MDNPLKYFAELRDPEVKRMREHLPEEDPFDCDRGDFELSDHRGLETDLILAYATISIPESAR